MIYFTMGDNMDKRFIPTYVSTNIYELDFNKVKDLGYKTLIIDLDNTLASPYVYEPDERCIELINKLKQMDFQIIVLSNNKIERVEKFVKNLNVKAYADVKKPYLKRVKPYLYENKIDYSKSIILGDQVITDVFMSNRLGIDVILFTPLTVKDEPITFIPRLLDKHFRKKIYKKNLAKEF